MRSVKVGDLVFRAVNGINAVERMETSVKGTYKNFRWYAHGRGMTIYFLDNTSLQWWRFNVFENKLNPREFWALVEVLKKHED